MGRQQGKEDKRGRTREDTKSAKIIEEHEGGAAMRDGECLPFFQKVEGVREGRNPLTNLRGAFLWNLDTRPEL
jgi:hypothetical protein